MRWQPLPPWLAAGISASGQSIEVDEILEVVRSGRRTRTRQLDDVVRSLVGRVHQKSCMPNPEQTACRMRHARPHNFRERRA